MFARRLQLCLSLSVLLASASVARAQIINGNQWPTPRLAVLTPTGGKVGTTFEVAFTGTECEEPEKLLFSHPGIKGTAIIPELPKPDPKAKPDPKKKEPVRPPITKFSVSIAGDVPPGYYDVRLVNKNGVSNPRRFVVGTLNEVAEKEPNNDVEQAQKVEIGTTINGAVTAGTDVDYFTFPAKKGQRVLIQCLTASIDSRLDAEIAVKGPKGNDVGYHRPIPQTDSLVDVTIPEDGDYLVRLNKFTYTVGNAEYFYRLNISTAPVIEAVFPPMIEPGKVGQITLYGRNLPGGKVDPTASMNGQPLEKLTVNVTAPNEPTTLKFSGLVSPVMGVLDGFEYRLASPAGPSNPVLLTYAKAPVVIENDDNDTVEKAQAVPVPCEIAGRIDKKRDRDWYVFDAKKGDVLMIDVLSHRLGASTDMYFILRNLATKADITMQDDSADNLSQRFFTTNRDPAPYRFVVPADGKYHLMVASHTGDNYADPTQVYRVRITKEIPDFRLFVMPSDESRPDSCRPSKGGTDHYTVYALREDGFKGNIDLTMEGLPAGVTCPPQTLSGNMKFTQLVVIAADNAADAVAAVKVTGTAVINGQKVVRQARPATVTWAVQPQQNIPTITRLDHELMIAVRDKAPGKLIAGKDKVAVSLGDKLEVPLKLTRVDPEFKANFQVQPVPADLPTGMTFGGLTFAPGKDDLKAVLTVGANVPPGRYNIVFRGFANISPRPKGKAVNTIVTATPVEVTVLPKQVATLSVDNANPTIKVGADGMITVKVARQFDYADAFKVEVVLPPNVKGITAPGITIPAGMNDAKLKISVAAGTPPANVQNLIVRATAVVNGNVTLTHETKINVNIAK
ncbi:MAG TPA: PPC domain-containing protein [Gemmataceae bacterium]|nr:PPC domain-containing protein [Gemmataceae bacterium]